MKLSLAWIFDHIDADWKQQDINLILSKFNTSTAEIEGFHEIKFDLRKFYLGKVIFQNVNEIKLSIPELNTETVLLARDNTVDIIASKIKKPVFMVTKQHENFSWTTLHDLGIDKDGFMPALDVVDKDLNGNWRKNFECDDIIIEIDNKSITHRPDMWGHRGFAREIAALLDLPFKDSKKFLGKCEVVCFDQQTKPSLTCPITIENQTENACSRFCGLHFKSIENKPSNVFIASRLLKVGSRPINGIIDLTNYLMQDWSQPVHAYDSTKIEGAKVVIRMAKHGEKILLLDGNGVELTNQDMVIANAKNPMCLAGVKGGVNSSVDPNTTSIFFESATFDAPTVRRSAFRHKTRTDSSARFEKTLDPNQAPEAILRFIYLLKQYKIKADYADQILSVGHPIKEHDIEVEHEFLEKIIGVTLTKEDVVKPLQKIGFKVAAKQIKNTGVVYHVTVPTFRGCKDIKIKEDILEEVLRFYGFYKIPLKLPIMQKKPFNFNNITKLRKIKNHLVDSVKMFEQQNYSFVDEDFLNEIDLKLNPTPTLLNPASQNNIRLIDSLVPSLFKNIKHNHVHQDSLAFFEFGRIWSLENKKINETKNLAGIFFEKRTPINFYDCKQHIIDLLRTLGLDTDNIKWQKVQTPEKEWYAAYQTANIILDHKKIGTIGNADTFFLSKLKIHEGCSAFIFELDGEYLLAAEPKNKRLAAISKFQESYFDLSFMAPFSVKFVDIKETIAAVSTLIKKVELVDFFEKIEWTDVKSLTFRVWVEHFDRTLEKEEIDTVMQQTISNVAALGAKLRA